MNRDIIFYASVAVALLAVFLVHKELKKTKKDVKDCMSFNANITKALSTQSGPPPPEVIPTSPIVKPQESNEETGVSTS